MVRIGSLSAWLAAFTLAGCQTNGRQANDGQSHWLGACTSSAECGDAACLCGLCSRGCSVADECGSARAAACVEVAQFGDGCGAEAVPARICVPSSSQPLPDAAAPATRDAAPVDMPRGGSNSVGLPDGGNAGAPAPDAAVDAATSGRDASSFDAAVCGSYHSNATPSPTMIRLVNGTNEQLYLGQTREGCDEPWPFTFETAAGEPIAGYGGGCSFSCEQLQVGQCSCNPGCSTQAVISLMPGDHYDAEWQGTVFTTEVMPDGCYPAAQCVVGLRCFVERTPDEPVTVKAFAYPEFRCLEGSSCGACEPHWSGGCSIPNADRVRGTPHPATATWTPGQAVVTLTF